MGRLPERLAEQAHIFLNVPVEKIDKKEKKWQLYTSEKIYEARTVVLALPVNKSLSLLSLSPAFDNVPPPINEIPESKIATVVMGFTDTAQIPFGFGYLAPEQEKRFDSGRA